MRRAAVAIGRGDALAHQSHVQWIPWGETTEVVGLYDTFETEYAAIRSGAALCDCPQRGVLEVSGTGRVAFLQRMLTQDVKRLGRGATAQAFWLNRKGRIDADLFLCDLGDRMLVDCAFAVAGSAAASLMQFAFSDDVQIVDVSETVARIGVHGPRALELLSRVGVDAPALVEPGRCAEGSITSTPCSFARRDATGEIGVEVFAPRHGLAELWRALLGARGASDSGRPLAKPCGWFAFNTARIEAGTPLFEIDFGTSSLPHESSLLASRVSFTKGCYLGQEVVARMQSLGKPKQVVCAFRVAGDALPVDGAAVFVSGTTSDPVGQVTSSTMSPMLGGTGIGFATVKTAHATAGATLAAAADDGVVTITVQEGLSAVPARSAVQR